MLLPSADKIKPTKTKEDGKMAYTEINYFQRFIDFIENHKSVKVCGIVLISILLLVQFFNMGSRIGEFIFTLLH